jgi:shikimate kinase
MSVVLVGYRGSGKTTVGRKLADRLWQTFVDTDDLTIAVAGKSISEIFQHHGEAHFRQLESDALRQALGRAEHVIALGGGAVMNPENRQLIKRAGHKVVYLRCEPKALLERIRSDPASATNRPDLTSLGGGIEEITSVLLQREPLYREIATFELDVTYLSPEEAVVHITRVM